MYFYYSNSGQVKFVSESKIETDLAYLKKNLTADLKTKMDRKDSFKVINGELVAEENTRKNVEDLDALRKDLKQKAKEEKLTNKDICQFIENFL